MSQYTSEYKQKLTTAAEAVKVVKDDSMIMYPPFCLKTPLLDEALAFRRDELHNVDILYITLTYMPEVMKSDPQGKTFGFIDASFSAATRAFQRMDIPIAPMPSLYHEAGRVFLANIRNIDVLFLAARPMDEEGYFNMGPQSSCTVDMIEANGGYKKNLKIIVEINDKIPHVHGDNRVHISQVHSIVENPRGQKLFTIPETEATDIDKKIARIIIDEMVDGACIQLGIGGMPNYVGKMLAESDFKDLGCHSEMFVDAYMLLHKSGRLTNKKKQIDTGKSVFTFALGSEALYEYLDNNPEMSCRTVSYTNSPHIIAQNDRVYSICSCIAVDIFGNVSSESVGYRQISGTGGQLDYHFASLHSEGGKGFVCMPSAKFDMMGNIKSNVMFKFEEGTQITVPANMTNYVVTEYGAVNLKCESLWDRIEKLVSIAHPAVRDDLLNQAKKAGLFKRSNRI
ncbi:MAG: butyryl-CoA:acetate CoA-transferase [Treponema sp.]|jgi:acyl-CoA hydrolase|nr:butyryl-CoA:acetate CoA-transferase [Treponema sp.]